jgi:hypothetical protein
VLECCEFWLLKCAEELKNAGAFHPSGMITASLSAITDQRRDDRTARHDLQRPANIQTVSGER